MLGCTFTNGGRLSKVFYVNNIGDDSSFSELACLFSNVGDVESLTLEVNTESARGMSFGVVEMATADQAQDCVARFHGEMLMGSRLSMSSNKPRVWPALPEKKKRR